MKLLDLERADDGLTMWSIDFTRERGGPKWKYPKVQRWKSHGRQQAVHFRIGWRYTAYGIHLVHQHLSSEVDELKSDPKYSNGA